MRPRLTLSALFVIAAAALVVGSSARAATQSQTLEDRQQAACYDDAQRLCPDDFPDVDKVKACMADKKMQVSAACQAFYPKDAK